MIARLNNEARLHVVLTRLREDAEPWARILLAQGIGASVCPCIAIRALSDLKTTRQVSAELCKTTHIALSSRRGALELRRQLSLMPNKLPADVLFAAVGPATARALAWTARPIAEASPARAEGLLAHLLEVATPNVSHVLLPGAKNGRRLVDEQLVAAGISARQWPLYETRALSPDDGPLHVPPEATHVVFTSPSQVRGFVSRRAWPTKLLAISFGPSTTRALVAENITVASEVTAPTLDGLVAAITQGDL